MKHKINYISTPDGHYVNLLYHTDYLINQEFPEKTFCQNWYKVSSEPKTLWTKSSNLKGWKLKNPSLVSLGIPSELSVEEYQDIDDYVVLDLYTGIYDRELIQLPVEFTQIANVNLTPGLIPFKYQMVGEGYINGKATLTERDIDYPTLSKIVVPPLFINQTQCSLSPVKSYNLIRAYVRENIDPKVAKISQDGTNVFVVKKLIHLHEPAPYQFDLNNSYGTRRKPKYETRFKTEKDVRFFSMTLLDYKLSSSEEGDKVWNIIEGFQGDNVEDLKNNIDNFLFELMEQINTPLQECPHCQGSGVMKPEELNYE